MAELRILSEPLPGVFLLECPYFPDLRGDFSKLFHADSLHSQGITFAPKESFLTRSKKNVLRGMHYQGGEAAHDKLVSCIRGSVLDVVVDIRHESPNFNKPFAVELGESTNLAVMIGKGYAHGFLAVSDDSWMLYSTSSVHAPSFDKGVLWDSIEFHWPIQNPILSLRDSSHPSIYQCQEKF